MTKKEYYENEKKFVRHYLKFRKYGFYYEAFIDLYYKTDKSIDEISKEIGVGKQSIRRYRFDTLKRLLFYIVKYGDNEKLKDFIVEQEVKYYSPFRTIKEIFENKELSKEMNND